MTRFETVTRAALAVVAASLVSATQCRAADIKPAMSFAAVSKIAAAGKTDEALAAVELALQTKKNDPQWRFLQSQLLAKNQRRAEALAVLTSLTEEFPNLPEPHNNLAVLQAAQGQTEQARASLEAALRADPAYGVAHENLGDVQLRLAIDSYQRALSLDPDRAALRGKLKQLLQLLDPPLQATPPSAK